MTSNCNQKAEWQSRLDQWRSSGLSGAAWCRENNIKYPVFLYWCKKTQTIGQKEDIKFVELTPPINHATGIKLEFRGIILHLSKDFDATTLQRCLQLLKDC